MPQGPFIYDIQNRGEGGGSEIRMFSDVIWGGGGQKQIWTSENSDTEDELEVVEEEDEAPMMNIFDVMKNPEFIADL